MRRLILLGVLCVSRALNGHAQQGLTTWLEQLAALRTLERSVREDYQTMTTGLTRIGDIRNTEYALHAAYYQSLATVNPAVALLRSKTLKGYAYDQTLIGGHTRVGNKRRPATNHLRP